MTLTGAGLRGCVVGAAVTAAVTLAVVVGVNLLNLENGWDGLSALLWILTLLPAIALGVGIGVAIALRLPLGWLVGLVAPAAGLAVLQPLPRAAPVQLGAVVVVYGATAAAVAALRATLDRQKV